MKWQRKGRAVSGCRKRLESIRENFTGGCTFQRTKRFPPQKWKVRNIRPIHHCAARLRLLVPASEPRQSAITENRRGAKCTATGTRLQARSKATDEGREGPRGGKVKRFFILAAMLLVAVSCRAQNTSVTATVTDPNGNPYAFGTGYAALVCPGNQQPTYNGYTVPRTFTITGLDGNGKFTQVVYDLSVIQPSGCGYQWHITYKDGVTTFITGSITSVTGSSVNESAAISAYAVLLPPAPIVTPPGGSSGQIQYNNSGAFGGIAGSSVTPSTGATTLTAGADTTTPWSIASHSNTQSATELDVSNQSSKSTDTPIVFRGRGFGSFSPSANPGLVHIIEESDALSHDAFAITNHTADLAKGTANYSLMSGGVNDVGQAFWCGGGASGDGGTNVYSCLLWGANDTMTASLGCPTCMGAPATIVPFSVQGFNGETGHIFNVLSSTGSVLSGIDASGVFDSPMHVTVTTGSSASLADGYSRTLAVNQEGTAGAAVTYTLPAASLGLVKCVVNSNGGAPNTGILTVATSGSGQFIIHINGVLTSSGGNVTSGGAAGDSACFYGVDSTHWQEFDQAGTWTGH